MKRYLVKYSGLEIISEQNANDSNVCLALFVKCGTGFENSRNYGITNLTNRIIFRRLNSIYGNTLFDDLRKIGADFDMRTSPELSAFLVSLKPEYFNKAVDVLLSIFGDIPFTERDVSTEKAVAITEAELNPTSFEDEVNANFFGCNKYKFSSKGDKNTIIKLKKADIEAWKNAYFISNNSCLVLTGNFSNENLQYADAQAQKIERQKKTVSTLNVALPDEQHFRKLSSDMTQHISSDISTVSIIFDVDLAENKTIYCGMLCAYLGLPYTGKLSACLKDKYAYTDSVSLRLIMNQGFACLKISYKILQENLADSLKLISDILHETKHKFSEENFLSVMEYFKEDMLYRGLCSLERCYAIGKYAFILNTDNSTIPELELLTDMSRSLCKAAQDILSGDNMLINIQCNTDRNEEYLQTVEAMAQLRVRLML